MTHGADFWNRRYADAEYLFGTEPNAFLAEHWRLLREPVLSLSEGEGRNAVFLASHGLEVVGVDLSSVALEKAQRLAASHGVTITTVLADLADFEPDADRYGAVVSISAHLPSEVRRTLYPRVERALQAGGVLILEAYSEEQPARGTGGPRDIDLLMTVDKIRREFPNLEPIILREIERKLAEGDAHQGMSSVVQFVGRKRA